jgi:hypothetical protein
MSAMDSISSKAIVTVCAVGLCAFGLGTVTGEDYGAKSARAALAALPTPTPVVVIHTRTQTLYRTRTVTRTVTKVVNKTITVPVIRTVRLAPPTAASKPTATPQPTARAVAASVQQVNALTMAEQYDANKIAAEGYYKNRIVQLRGQAQDVNQDILGSYYVMIKPDGYDGWTSMQCYVSGPQSLMSVVKGNDVTVRGRVDDMTLGIIPLKDCQVVS